MTHEDIKILISAYCDGEVNSSEKNIVEEHLNTCQSCQKDFKMYKAMSSPLLKWSNESLSPDAAIKVQKRFEQRREPMFTKRTAVLLTTTIALAVIISSVVQVQLKKGVQAELFTANDNPGVQYKKTKENMSPSMQYEPYYLTSKSGLAKDQSAAPAIESTGGIEMAVSNARFDSASMGQGLRKASYSGGIYLGTVREAGTHLINNNYPLYAKSSINNDHKVIKNAAITVKVQSAQKTQAELDGIVAKYDGIIINFQINELENGSRTGLLVFNVLPKNLRNILIEIRKLGEVQLENQSGVDITSQYEYLQNRLDNDEADRDRFQNILVKNPNNIDSNLYIQGEMATVERSIAALKNNIKLLDDQSYMATVVVNFYDTIAPVVIKPMSFKDKMTLSLKENLKATLQTCYDIGINSFNGIVIVLSFLLQVVVWSLIIWGIYLLIRKFMKK